MEATSSLELPEGILVRFSFGEAGLTLRLPAVLRVSRGSTEVLRGDVLTRREHGSWSGFTSVNGNVFVTANCLDQYGDRLAIHRVVALLHRNALKNPLSIGGGGESIPRPIRTLEWVLEGWTASVFVYRQDDNEIDLVPLVVLDNVAMQLSEIVSHSLRVVSMEPSTQVKVSSPVLRPLLLSGPSLWGIYSLSHHSVEMLHGAALLWGGPAGPGLYGAAALPTCGHALRVSLSEAGGLPSIALEMQLRLLMLPNVSLNDVARWLAARTITV